MSADPKILTSHPEADDSRLWYPLHPRWIPLLRIVGALGVGYAIYAIYHIVLERSWSLAAIPRWGIPAVLVLSCLGVQPELRARTFLNRIGSFAHLLLVFLVLPLALFAIVLRCLHS